jgi:hypothetical protein
MAKYQISSTKLQTNLKFLPCGILPWAGSPLGEIPQGKYQMTERGLEFGIWVIAICLIFEICDLEFLLIPLCGKGHGFREPDESTLRSIRREYRGHLEPIGLR